MPQDYNRIGALHARSWQAAYAGLFAPGRLSGDITRSLVAGWQGYAAKPGDLVLVAETPGPDHRLLGFCAIWCDGPPYLDNLHVRASAQGAGVGRALLAAGADALEQRGLASLSLLVFERNTDARAFYAGLGGVEVGTVDQDVFGEIIPSVRVVWRNLALLRGDRPRT